VLERAWDHFLICSSGSVKQRPGFDHDIWMMGYKTDLKEIPQKSEKQNYPTLEERINTLKTKY